MRVSSGGDTSRRAYRRRTDPSRKGESSAIALAWAIWLVRPRCPSGHERAELLPAGRSPLARRLALLRHGESVWNRERRFAGWSDVALSARGIDEATRAGEWFAAQGCRFDRCFTSQLSRAIDTATLALAAMGLDAVPTTRSWQLNERHYGAAQGLTWWQSVLRYGPRRVVSWRRDHDRAPPPLLASDPRHPAHDLRYADLSPDELPITESLNHVRSRVLSYWAATLVPELRAGHDVLVVAHRNVLHALSTELDGDDSEVARVRFGTGQPLLVELDEGLGVRRYVVPALDRRG